MVKRKAIVLDIDTARAKTTSLLQYYKRRKTMKKRTGVSAKALISRISKDPFPRERRCKMTWSPDTQYSNPGSTSAASVIRLTDIYDPDYSNHFGNFQPLFFDQLLSATGPYQNFRVNGWKGKITLVNVSAADGSVPLALECYWKQGATNAVDVDTWAEVQSQAGIQSFLLGPKDSDSATKTIYFNGRMESYIPKGVDAEDYSGTYGSSPSKPIYGAIAIRNAKSGSASAINCYIKVVIEFDVTVFGTDAVQS